MLGIADGARVPELSIGWRSCGREFSPTTLPLATGSRAGREVRRCCAFVLETMMAYVKWEVAVATAIKLARCRNSPPIRPW
jgi:hypothetical protein